MTAAKKTVKKKAEAGDAAPVKTQAEKEREIAALNAKLKKADEVLAPQKEVEEVKEPEVDTSDIDVSDPEEIVPEKLPFIVKPKGGKWKNKEQEEYAKILNAYAYKNRKKWKANRIDPVTKKEIPNSSKKDVMLKNLAMIGENPEFFKEYTGYSLGEKQPFVVKNKLMED